MPRLTADQLRELEALCAKGIASPQRSEAGAVLMKQLLQEYRQHRNALDTVKQYLDQFAEAEGTATDVPGLVSDLKEVLDGVAMLD